MKIVNSVRAVLLGLFVATVSGCMSLAEREQEQSANGPWPVAERSAMPFGHRYEFGPFATTGIGPLQGGDIRKAAAPSPETVRFVKERPLFAFELTHADGTIARVRTGADAAAPKKTFLQRVMGDESFMAGSVEINGELAGEFSIRYMVGNEQPHAGFVKTSVGNVTISRRFVPTEQPESKVAAFFEPDHEKIEQYRLGEVIVATRRCLPREIFIDPQLPRDAQLCIAAAMTVPLKQESAERGASQGAALSTSASLAPSGL